MAKDVVPPPLGPRPSHQDYGLLPAGPRHRPIGRCLTPNGSGSVDRVEICVILDRIDPPMGRLQVTSGAGHAQDEEPEISFTGWLGLLRALYLVTGSGPENR